MLAGLMLAGGVTHVGLASGVIPAAQSGLCLLLWLSVAEGLGAWAAYQWVQV